MLCYHVIKMSYKTRLVFAYYKIFRFCCFKKTLQSVLKTWQMLKWKKYFFWKISKCRNTVFCVFESRFLVIFSSNYRHRMVLKIPFPDHIFPKISKYRFENLHLPSTGKYYASLVLKNMVVVLMLPAKMAFLGLNKIMVFWNKSYDVIIYVHDVTNQFISYGANCIVDVVMWPKFGNSSIYTREVIRTLML